jgi:hypothetical protein
MTSHSANPHPLPAYQSWQAAFARVEKSGGNFRNVAMPIRLPLQGCYSMTD